MRGRPGRRGGSKACLSIGASYHWYPWDLYLPTTVANHSQSHDWTAQRLWMSAPKTSKLPGIAQDVDRAPGRLPSCPRSQWKAWIWVDWQVTRNRASCKSPGRLTSCPRSQWKVFIIFYFYYYLFIFIFVIIYSTFLFLLLSFCIYLLLFFFN